VCICRADGATLQHAMHVCCTPLSRFLCGLAIALSPLPCDMLATRVPNVLLEHTDEISLNLLAFALMCQSPSSSLSLSDHDVMRVHSRRMEDRRRGESLGLTSALSLAMQEVIAIGGGNMEELMMLSLELSRSANAAVELGADPGDVRDRALAIFFASVNGGGDVDDDNDINNYEDPDDDDDDDDDEYASTDDDVYTNRVRVLNTSCIAMLRALF
jgi:hypothetical protein